jgi:gas vesicle protein
MKNSSKVLVALGAGVAIGGLLGVLFAPGKGSETRKKIAEKGNELTDAVKEKLNMGREKMEGLREGLREKINVITKKAEELV